jgi:hypothetical protein
MIQQLLALLPRVKPATRILQSVERISLTQHHTLHVVRIHGAEIVLATYPNGCTVVDASAQQSFKVTA